MDPMKYLSGLRDYSKQIIQDINNRNVDLPAGPAGAKELEKRTISIALRALGSLAKAWCAFSALRQFAMLLVVPAQASVAALFCWGLAGVLAHDLAVVGKNMRPGLKQGVQTILSVVGERISDALRTDSVEKAAEAVVADTPPELAGTLLLRHLYPLAKQATAAIHARNEANDRAQRQ